MASTYGVINDDVVEHRSIASVARSLYTEGYVVLPFLLPEEIDIRRQRFLDVEATFPEFPTLPDNKPKWGSRYKPFVQGGFGAYGHPSSFHNEFVRHLRRRLHGYALPFLVELWKLHGLDDNELRVEQLIDRMLRRLPNKSPTTEGWHRDYSNRRVYPQMESSDIVLGGWINLNNYKHRFVCCPGTHIDKETKELIIPTNEGMASIRDKDLLTHIKNTQQTIEIPAGSVILFYQNIAHMVAGKGPSDKDTRKRAKIPENDIQDSMYRLFVGFRLTMNDQALLNADTIRQFRAVTLPSGQKANMYSNNAGSFHKTHSKASPAPMFREAHMPRKYIPVDEFLQNLTDSVKQPKQTKTTTKQAKSPAEIERTTETNRKTIDFWRQYAATTEPKGMISYPAQTYVGRTDYTLSFDKKVYPSYTDAEMLIYTPTHWQKILDVLYNDQNGSVLGHISGGSEM